MNTGAAAARVALQPPLSALALAFAFLKRSVAVYLSYRLRAFLGLASLAVTVLGLVLVGRLVSSAGMGFDERFGMSYTAYALVGVVAHGSASAGLRVFRASVRREQLQGTLEHLMSSPSDPAALIVLSAAGELLLSAGGGLLMLAGVSRVAGLCGVLTSGVLVPLALYALSMTGLGLVSAGVVLVHKEGEPVSWTLSTLTGLLGGVVFPVELLPEWLGNVSFILPTTHALSLIRSALVPGHAAPAESLSALASMALVLPIIGLLTLRRSLVRARREGSLGHY